MLCQGCFGLECRCEQIAMMRAADTPVVCISCGVPITEDGDGCGCTVAPGDIVAPFEGTPDRAYWTYGALARYVAQFTVGQTVKFYIKNNNEPQTGILEDILENDASAPFKVRWGTGGHLVEYASHVYFVDHKVLELV